MVCVHFARLCLFVLCVCSGIEDVEEVGDPDAPSDEEFGNGQHDLGEDEDDADGGKGGRRGGRDEDGGAESKEAEGGSASGSADDEEEAGILEAQVDPVAWRAECERVASKLKDPTLAGAAGAGPSAGLLTVGKGGGSAASAREWRAHQEQTQAAQALISRLLPDARGGLERLAGELSELAEAISAKERFVNNAFKSLSAEQGKVAEEAARLQAEFNLTQKKVGDLTTDLANTNDILEDIKASLEERGSSMTDTSPLIRIKASLAALRAEVKAMDLQIGVLGHAVMQSKITHKVGGAGDKNKGKGAKGKGGKGGDSDSEDDEDKKDDDE
jgi:estrogen-related receptor beta like 1